MCELGALISYYYFPEKKISSMSFISWNKLLKEYRCLKISLFELTLSLQIYSSLHFHFKLESLFIKYYFCILTYFFPLCLQYFGSVFSLPFPNTPFSLPLQILSGQCHICFFMDCKFVRHLKSHLHFCLIFHNLLYLV